MAPLLSNGLCGLSEGHHYYYDDDYNDDGDQILVWKSCCQMSILGHCQIQTMRTWGHKDMKTRGLTVEVEGKIVEHSSARLLEKISQSLPPTFF